MSLNQSFISDFSEYSRCSQRTKKKKKKKKKYKLHYVLAQIKRWDEEDKKYKIDLCKTCEVDSSIFCTNNIQSMQYV